MKDKIILTFKYININTNSIFSLSCPQMQKRVDRQSTAIMKKHIQYVHLKSAHMILLFRCSIFLLSCHQNQRQFDHQSTALVAKLDQCVPSKSAHTTLLFRCSIFLLSRPKSQRKVDHQVRITGNQLLKHERVINMIIRLCGIVNNFIEVS